MVKTLTENSKELINLARYKELKVGIDQINNNLEIQNKPLFCNGVCLTTERKRDFIREDIEEVAISGLDIFSLKIYKEKREKLFTPSNSNHAIQDWLYLRLGLSLKILDKCKYYLKNRVVGSQELIKNPIIKDNIARFITESTSLILDMDHVNFDSKTNELFHQRITRANDHLLKLCGAHGYLDDDIISIFYISKIIENIYGGTR